MNYLTPSEGIKVLRDVSLSFISLLDSTGNVIINENRDASEAEERKKSIAKYIDSDPSTPDGFYQIKIRGNRSSRAAVSTINIKKGDPENLSEPDTTPARKPVTPKLADLAIDQLGLNRVIEIITENATLKARNEDLSASIIRLEAVIKELEEQLEVANAELDSTLDAIEAKQNGFLGEGGSTTLATLMPLLERGMDILEKKIAPDVQRVENQLRRAGSPAQKGVEAEQIAKRVIDFINNSEDENRVGQAFMWVQKEYPAHYERVVEIVSQAAQVATSKHNASQTVNESGEFNYETGEVD